MSYFLGIDGGQSHTTALIADGRGRILGRGGAGASNHTREPGGQERLIAAVSKSVSEALQDAGLLKNTRIPPEGGTTNGFKFASAHLAMTGEPEDKAAIVRELLQAEHLVVGHDAPGALAGALVGDEGVIVLAGTGSVACGETREGKFAQVGGHGYMFGDKGSAFAIAREAVAMVLGHEDIDDESSMRKPLLAHFHKSGVREIAEAFYCGSMTRDSLASFAAKVGRLAEKGDTSASYLIEKAALDLYIMASETFYRLEWKRKPVRISYGGGVFKSRRLLARFTAEITVELPQAQVVAPRFNPDIGALLLAYRQAGKKITPKLLDTLTETQK